MSESKLFLHTSNRMEDLAGMLARLLENRDGGDPFQAERVLVQSRGMGRWLSLQLAEARGICLNVKFPFPRDVIDEILAVLLPEWKPAASFRRDTMVWTLFRLLGEFRSDARFLAIAHYLEGNDAIKRIQLADRLANLFDQYLVYRPDWLVEWEEDRHAEDWQAVLWRQLVQEAGESLHLARAWARLSSLRSYDRRSAHLPPRLSVFGISSLPPLFLDVLRWYARLGGELHLFLLQPTASYWGDLLSEKRQAKLPPGEAVYVEQGHPLLASLGRQGQDLLNLLIDADFQQPDEGQVFQSPEGGALLCQLQTDILALRDREKEEPKISVGADDSSIRIHSCHSPMREVEVLHDQLLELFQNDQSLRPRDVLVMIPDVEAYAPYIQAVFGAPESKRAQIPFSVVDRRPRSAFHIVDAWFRLLELSGSRFGVRDVVSLLETPPFRARFGLSDRDVNQLRAWAQATGIRWGMDAAHRGAQGLPEIGETTWQNGIDQWLLGYAMRERHEGIASSFQKIFPFDEIEGGNLPRLDQFLRALDFIVAARAALEKPRPLSAWCDALTGLFENLMDGIEEAAPEADRIRAALGNLRRTAIAVRIDGNLSLDVILYFLEKILDDSASSGGFLSGGVTFCTLQPMRTVPARVVCLLGMNDDAFPRRPQQLGFDRMRNLRRVGDRSAREDDRYLFLETLLSVREALIVTYIGQSAHDLSEVPPSVLVSELLDHLSRACVFPDGKGARDFLICRHRLQPFHPDYFTGGSLFSYSQENLAACQRLMGEPEEAPAFVDRRVAAPDDEWKTVTVRQLVAFFRNPAEYFAKERLGLRLPRENALLEDVESFSLDSLHEYLLTKDAVDGILEHRPAKGWELLQARGLVPLGTPGIAVCHAIEEEALSFAEKVVHQIGGLDVKNNQLVDGRMVDFHLRGDVGPFFGERLVIYRPAKLSPKDCVCAWVQHVVACWAAAESGAPPYATTLIGKDRTVTLAPRDDAAERLAELLGWYWRGLQEPLPFFPGAAYAYAEAKVGKRPETALAKAIDKFAGGGFAARGASPELDDPYVKICWGEGPRAMEAIGEDFMAIAAGVFLEIEIFLRGDGK